MTIIDHFDTKPIEGEGDIEIWRGDISWIHVTA
jgi:hypothetical protein